MVDPFVGTLGDFGQLSPADVVPFGMVQLGPNTSPPIMPAMTMPQPG
jgi:hypothetical protein